MSSKRQMKTSTLTEMHHEIYLRHLKCIKVSYGVASEGLISVKKFKYDLQSLFMPNQFLNGMSHSLKKDTYEEIVDKAEMRIALAKNELTGYIYDILPFIYERESKWSAELITKYFEGYAIQPRELRHEDIYIMQNNPEVWVRTIFNNFIRDWVSLLRRLVAMGEPSSRIVDGVFDDKNSVWTSLVNKVTTLCRSATLEKVNEARFNAYALNKTLFSYVQKSNPFRNILDRTSSRVGASDNIIPIANYSGSFEDVPPMLKNFNSLSTYVPVEHSKDDVERGRLEQLPKQLFSSIAENSRRWFSEQPDDTKKGQIGERKFRLLNSGKITETQLWNFSQNPMGVMSL